MDRDRQWLISCLLLAMATGLVLAPDHFVPMLARAFLVQWASVFALLVPFMVRWKWWWPSGASLACAGMLFMSAQVPAAKVDDRTGAHAIRIAHMNVLQPNGSHAAVIAQALATGADVISVQEVDAAWASALHRGLAGTYPYHHIVARSDCYGIALFSRIAWREVRTIEIAGAPFIKACMSIAGQDLEVLAVHATSPTSIGHHRRRNQQLRTLAAMAARTEAPLAVIGDLNTVHWDRAYHALCATGRLRAHNGKRPCTWPAIGPFAMIPLDHVLTSSHLLAIDVNDLVVPGSDHRGLVADISFTGHAH